MTFCDEAKLLSLLRNLSDLFEFKPATHDYGLLAIVYGYVIIRNTQHRCKRKTHTLLLLRTVFIFACCNHTQRFV